MARRRSAALLLLGLLAACRSVDPGLGLTPGEPTPQAMAPVSTAPSAAEPIQFLPAVGIPADKAQLLSMSLGEAARTANVTILPAAEGIAPRRLKGYLSTVDGASGEVVVYVWDVVDPGGERISRIQGQVETGGSGTSWSGVGEATLREIASRTIAALGPSSASLATSD
ncbi:hypothetical protein [Aureimonas psammosilenae]|uniref:hypothetical protein n=1 Tax=Aureimonas psammosilenae TaxID=2495496 RepID=UPI001260B3E8|nr:hypothetical protein [Aureimonas psammosilenae]